MHSPLFPFLSSLRGRNTRPAARPLTLAVLAYATAICASVGAAAAFVGAGVPVDVLVAVA